ncbi:tyrosine-type recombinase/integrase [Alicyclobacillus tolerans]|uniref:tyrosine-type recombinase/integrase n=1 Tax=Alicyclobacillus tolerans TaxID=90970 RepID=UPI001F01A021|nr:tyrosine-type recombinase/integrase [Alicyclobacillus tolerans]MCF8564549.1 tyrosine-type recombinase/integrase [Alicyclobacillus tolerans]
MARRNNRLADVINLANESFKVHKTLGDATNEYMQNIYRRALSEDTLKHEQEGMRSVYKLLPASTPLSSINRSLIEIRVLDSMRESGLKANTVNGRIKTLSRVLEHAVELGYISTNPARQVPLMKLTASQIQTLNNEQIAAILAQIDSSTFTGLRDKTLIKLMLDTGIRIREAMDLTVDRVDLRERKLRAIKGKNRKEPFL